MDRYQKYLTGLLSCSNTSLGLMFPAKWGRILFEDHKNKYSNRAFVDSKEMPYKHLIIESSSEEKAIEVLNLILDSLTVFGACNFFGYNIDFKLIKLSDNCKNFPEYLTTDELYFAGIMTARASFKESYVYAICKLALSLWIFSASPMDLDPAYGKLEMANLAKPFSPKIRVSIASAIVNAYSAIEELNFGIFPKDRIETKKGKEIYATKDEKGNFLPDTEKDMNSRLKNAKIDLEESFSWSLRGKKKIIEKRRVFSQKIKKSAWSFGPYVRDEEIHLINAIDRASFLRSQVASHKLGISKKKKGIKKSKEIKVLSIYDVSNVQMLARRLILDSLKLWALKE